MTIQTYAFKDLVGNILKNLCMINVLLTRINKEQ